MNSDLFKQDLYFKFNPSPPQIVTLVIKTPHTKFQLIRFVMRGVHAIGNFEFSSKRFFAHFRIISVKIPGI